MFAPGAARSQAGFPNRPIRIVVPVSPGGGVDTFARLIAAKVKTQRDVHFFVENRTGGNSTVGGLDVQRAAPDGYTVLFHASTHNLARLVMRNVPYDPRPISPRLRSRATHRCCTSLRTAGGKDRGGDRRRSQASPRHGPSQPRSSARPVIAAVAFNQYTGLNLPIMFIAALRRLRTTS